MRKIILFMHVSLDPL